MGSKAFGTASRAAIIVVTAMVCLVPLLAAPNQVRAQGRPEFVEDELLVKFKPRVPPAAQAAIHSQAAAQVVREVRGLDVKVVKVPPQALAQVLQAYQRNPNIEFAERNGIAYADWTPNDPSFPSQQWSLNNTGQNSGKVDADVDAPQAWDVYNTTMGAATPPPAATVSIVDTGIDPTHQDLTAKIVDARNWYDGGPTADVYGHGTHVAGITAAITNNAVGIAGTCPGCNLLNAKVCDDSGNCPYDRVANGVLWSVGCEWREQDPATGGLGKCLSPIRAQVINMSISGTGGSTTLQLAIDRAAELGAVMACAAGNNGTSQTTYPAGYTNCIAVAATTNQDQRASYSSYGSWVDVAAPGSNIYSTLIGSKYGTMSGTSMASPHVAGEAGMVWSQLWSSYVDPNNRTNPPDAAKQAQLANLRGAVRSRIESTADPINSPGRPIGRGRINACRALKNAASC